jgi:hypothetical protein
MNFHDIMQDILLPAAAVYSVIVSTLVLVWDIAKWKKEKRADTVKLAIEIEFSEEGANIGRPEAILFITVTNIGKKPTTVTSMRVMPDILPEKHDGYREQEGVFYQMSNQRLIRESERVRARYYDSGIGVVMACRCSGFTLELAHSFTGAHPHALKIVPDPDAVDQVIYREITL